MTRRDIKGAVARRLIPDSVSRAGDETTPPLGYEQSEGRGIGDENENRNLTFGHTYGLCFGHSERCGAETG